MPSNLSGNTPTFGDIFEVRVTDYFIVRGIFENIFGTSGCYGRRWSGLSEKLRNMILALFLFAKDKPDVK